MCALLRCIRCDWLSCFSLTNSWLWYCCSADTDSDDEEEVFHWYTLLDGPRGTHIILFNCKERFWIRIFTTFCCAPRKMYNHFVCWRTITLGNSLKTFHVFLALYSNSSWHHCMCCVSLKVAAVERKGGYNQQCDIWAVGITAIEFAEKQPPMFDLHPMRWVCMDKPNSFFVLTLPTYVIVIRLIPTIITCSKWYSVIILLIN